MAKTPRSSLELLRMNYRSNCAGDVHRGELAEKFLGEAAEALNLAVLALEGPREEARDDKNLRVTRAHKFLVEAVTTLSKAKIYIPGVHTYDLPVLMASEPDPSAECARLYHIATRLLWLNHSHLPVRYQGEPLSPEDEASLARVYQGLTMQARIQRVLYYRWILVTVICAISTPMFGWPAALATIFSGILAVYKVAKHAPPALPASG